MKKRYLSYVILLLVPIVVLGGALLFPAKRYAWSILCVTVLSCAPFFLCLERHGAKRLLLIAAMTALSVVGRILFAPLPAFKPVTAMVVITAMYFGKEAGFMTGALSAVLSNFSFGQGPWTPFQMFSWGIIGLIAGLLAAPLKRSKLFLTAYAVFSGVLYSILMDVWTVLWADGYFNPVRYAAALASALPFTVEYAVSNVIFCCYFPAQSGKYCVVSKRNTGCECFQKV